MTTLILVGIAFLVALIGLPWIVEALFGRRVGVWLGALETISVAGLLLYWLYQWNAGCNPGPVEIVGNMAYDNDATCRALFFGAPILLVVVVVTLALLIPSVFILLVESRKRSTKAT